MKYLYKLTNNFDKHANGYILKTIQGESIMKEKENIKKTLKIINILMSVIIVILLCFFVVKVFFVTSIIVNQTSMYPTYSDGETVYVNRLGGIERGTVAVYFDADISIPRLASSFSMFKGSDVTLLIKRVVALAGDKIWLENTGGSYEIKIQFADNDNVIAEEYIDKHGEKVELAPITFVPDTAGVLYDATQWNPYVVGEGCAFMIGDNRDESKDSRMFGDVPLSRIIGIAIN